MRKYIKYTLEEIDEWFWLNQFRLYRALRGGIWYRHESTGQLPGLYGCWWTREEYHHKRYIVIIKTEDYEKETIL